MGSDVRIIFLMSTIWMLLRSLMVLKRSLSHLFGASGKVISGGWDFCEYLGLKVLNCNIQL